jgi:integrase
MCRRLGWDMNIHQLRHYSATELVAAGVELRTIAGRLGHSGGGVTTLRVYSAWMPEADSRAATALGTRRPAPPGLSETPSAAFTSTAAPVEDGSLYRRIAGDLLGAIDCGALAEGDPIPTPERARQELRRRLRHRPTCRRSPRRRRPRHRPVGTTNHRREQPATAQAK